MVVDDQSRWTAGGDGEASQGLVVAIQANYYRVRLPLGAAAGSRPLELLCTRRARLKKTGQQVMVGDWVQLEAVDWAGGRGAIAAIAPRRTVLDRPPMANADQILLVFALAEPDLDPQQLGRFLVKAESTGIPVSLCLNKHDLVSEATQQHWQTQLQQWGYSPVLISLHLEPSLTALEARLQGLTTVVSGPSGVGKSSLINRLVPQATLRTGSVSGKLGRGRHTTRHVELFELAGGGFLADTPGFNQPDLTVSPLALGQCFPEIRQRLGQGTCQFKDCLHQGDPGCVVAPDWDRYEFYLTLLEEAIAYQDILQRQSNPDAAHKLRMGEKGQPHHDPRLASKKYRRPSRRAQKQALGDFGYSLLDSAEDPESSSDDAPELY
ncbi:MAG TPA: small ribosomal subunit biogenesis GTPase RsgA [Nodosilinea sp.]|nr:small ribosomal subunit biogenesis GTPase RsgA [Nodosilinea sp.]